jgi:hypothetical protein
MRMMPRNDEELRGPSRRNKGGDITKKEQLGMKSLCCSTLDLYCRQQYFDLYCRQLTKRILETSRGIFSVGRMSELDQK